MTQSDKDLTKFFVLIGAGYFLILRPIFLKLGVEKTEKEKETKETIEKVDALKPSQNPFTGRTFLANIPAKTKYVLLTPKSAQGLAKKLREAFTIFGDNETQAIGIFRQLKNQAQVAQLTDVFFKTYTLDLFSFLKNGTPYGGFLTTAFSGLNDKELVQIINIINKLPKYR